MDAGTSNVLPQVHSALAALHAAVPNKESQRQAQTFLQQVQASLSVDAAIQLAATLFAPLLSPHPAPWEGAHVQPAVHFGFHLLDDRVLAPAPWDALTEQNRAALRQLALSLLPAVSSQEAQRCFPAWTRQKVAGLLAALALREWPQYWPDFIQSLISLGTQRAMLTVCGVFKVLLDDVHEFGDRISPTRRSELSKALNIALEEVMSFVKDSAERCYNAGDIGGLAAVLGTVESLLTSCDLEKVLTAQLVSASVTLMQHPAARDPALEALSMFAVRKIPVTASHVAVPSSPSAVYIKDRLFPELLDFVAASSCNTILVDSFLPVDAELFPSVRAAARTSPSTLDVESHAFHARFVSMMADVGLSYFDVCFLPFQLIPSELTPVQKSSAMRYLEFMLAAMAHPSLAIRDAAMRFFSAALSRKTRDSKIAKKGKAGGKNGSVANGVVEYAHGSLEAARSTSAGRQLLLMLSVGFINAATLGLVEHPSDLLATAVAGIDFDGDEGEQREVVQELRARAIACMGSSTALCGTRGLHVALDRLAGMVQTITAVSASGGVPDPEGAAAVATSSILAHPLPPGQDARWAFEPFHPTAFALLDVCAQAVAMAADGVVMGVVVAGRSSGEPLGDVALNRLGALFDQIANISNPNLQGIRVQSFKMFVPVLQRSPERLVRALQVLTCAATDASDEAMRSKACSSLSSLVARIARVDGSVLADVRQQLCEFVAPRLVEARRPIRQKGHLVEAATSCVLTLNSIEEKTIWIETLLRPLTSTLSPSAGWCSRVFGTSGVFNSPSSLFQFIADAEDNEERREFMTSLCILQVCTHQVVRESSYGKVPLSIPAPLSRSIAPVCVELCVRLIPIVHGLYNEARFPVLREADPYSALLPTSRELVSLIHDDVAYLNAVPSAAVDAKGVVVDSGDALRQADLLSRAGLPVPGRAQERPREMVRLLRVGLYELLRNSILSGVMTSTPHVIPVLDAICVDYAFLEPIHLYYLVNRVIRVLLSFQVVSTAPNFIPQVAASGVPRIVGRLVEQVEAIGANQVIASGDAILDMGREQGRIRLIRVAVDLIAGLFPKPSPSARLDELPPGERNIGPLPLEGSTDLSAVLWALFRTLCSVHVAVADTGASRSACDLLSRFVSNAPDNAGRQYASMLEPCVQSAVHSYERGGDESAMCAMASIIQRYPSESAGFFEHSIANETPAVRKGFMDAFQNICHGKSSDRKPDLKKKTSQSLGAARKLIRLIAAMHGIFEGGRRSILVKSVPKAMNVVNPVRSAARLQAEGELFLGEAAIDSLFGSGDPM